MRNLPLIHIPELAANYLVRDDHLKSADRVVNFLGIQGSSLCCTGEGAV